MRKIENIYLNMKQSYLSKGVWSITNKGSEIKPANFLIKEGEKTKKKGRMGKFGIGLKDAIRVKSHFLIYRDKTKIVDRTEHGDVIIEDNMQFFKGTFNKFP